MTVPCGGSLGSHPVGSCNAFELLDYSHTALCDVISDEAEEL